MRSSGQSLFLVMLVAWLKGYANVPLLLCWSTTRLKSLKTFSTHSPGPQTMNPFGAPRTFPSASAEG